VWRLYRQALLPLLAALVLFTIPTGAWAFARWRFDRWRFFDGLFNYDFVALVSRPLEGHGHSWFFYLDVLQKNHYDWLVTAGILLLVMLASRREHPLRLPITGDMRILFGAWAGATLLIPTLIATKLPWYVNSFYPLFAIVVAAIITAAFNAFPLPAQRRERVVVGAMVVIAFAVAETKLAWYSYKQRDLGGSMQALFVNEPEMVQGRRVLLQEWDPADRFVLTHIADGEPVTGNPEQVAAGADEHDVLMLMPATGGGWVLSSARRTAEGQVEQ
jgi:4-amino-4-deoxy-L-arabinose transferase-like glycosyltransferase